MALSVKNIQISIGNGNGNGNGIPPHDGKRSAEQEAQSPFSTASPRERGKYHQNDREKFMSRLKGDVELRKAFLTVDQEKALLENVSEDKLQEADDAALEQAIQASLAIAPKFDAPGNREVFEIVRKESDAYYGIAPQDNPRDSETGRLLQVEPNQGTADTDSNNEEMSLERCYQEVHAMASGNENFLLFLDEKGLTTAESSAHDSNCCINSLLQLATGNFDEIAHIERAKHLKGELVEHFQDDVPNEKSMLHADYRSKAFRYLINRINEMFKVDMVVHVVQATETGRPALTELPGDIPPIGTNPVVLWNQGGHFVPVIKKPTSEK